MSREWVEYVPYLIRPCYGTKTHGSGERSHNRPNHLPPRNRCLQGRADSRLPFPGALPPATLSIPFGDSQKIYNPYVRQKIWGMLSVCAGT